MSIVKDILEEMELEDEDELPVSLSTLRKSWGEILYDIDQINNSDSIELVEANKEITVNEKEKSFEINIKGKKAYLYKTEETKRIINKYLNYIHDFLTDSRFIKGIIIKVRRKG